MNHAALIDSNTFNPLQRGPLCHRFRRIAAAKTLFWRLLDASLLMVLVTGTLVIAF